MTKRGISAFFALASFAGIGLVEFFSRPIIRVADPATGRVCPALDLARHTPEWIYYTTQLPCTASWAFTVVFVLACLNLLALKLSTDRERE